MPQATKAFPGAALVALALAPVLAFTIVLAASPASPALAFAADASGRSGLAGAAEALRNELAPSMLTFDKHREAKGAAGAIDITNARVQGLQDVMYTGRSETPTVTLKLDNRTLRAGEDFSIRFEGDTVNPGTVAVSIEGMGAYAGSIETSFTILPADLSHATVDVIPDQKATGAPVCPLPTVKLDGEELEASVDYFISYSNNVEEGTAIVSIEGTGNCTGETRATFEIVEADADNGIPAMAAIPAAVAVCALIAAGIALLARRHRAR